MPHIMKPHVRQPGFLQEALEGRRHIIRGEMRSPFGAKDVIVMRPGLPGLMDLLCLSLLVGKERLAHHLWQDQTSASSLRFRLHFDKTVISP